MYGEDEPQKLQYISSIIGLFLLNCHKLSKLHLTNVVELPPHHFKFTLQDVQDMMTLANKVKQSSDRKAFSGLVIFLLNPPKPFENKYVEVKDFV